MSDARHHTEVPAAVVEAVRLFGNACYNDGADDTTASDPSAARDALLARIGEALALERQKAIAEAAMELERSAAKGGANADLYARRIRALATSPAGRGTA